MAALVGGLLLATFAAVLVGRDTFFFRDFSTLAYPTIHYQREAFWRGELPFWNPLSHCGVPFLAQWNTLVFYPLSLIYLLLPLPWSLNLFCVLHLGLAAWGMYRWSRAWGTSAAASGMAAVAFAFGGLTLSSHIYPNYLIALGWAPWVVWVTQEAALRGGRWLVPAVLVGACQLLSGAPEIVLQTWVLTLGLCWFAPPGSVPLFPRVVRGLSVVVLIALLCAPQMLPFFDLLRHSQRGSGYATQLWTMPGTGWANLLVPLFRCFQTPQGFYYQIGQAFVASYYAGIGILVLALVAVLARSDRRVRLLAFLCLLALVVAMGDNGFLYAGLRKVFPWLGVARFPIKAVYLAGMALPLLAALGVDTLIDRATTRPKWLPLVLAGMAVLMFGAVAFQWSFPGPGEQPRAVLSSALSRLAFLAGTLGLLLRWAWFSERGRGWLAATALGLLTWGDLITHSNALVPTLPSSALSGRMAEIPPAAPPGFSRAMTSARAEYLLLTRTLPSLLNDLYGSRLSLWSNLNLLEGIAKVNGAITLQIGYEAQLEQMLYALPPRDYPGLRAFLAVSHTSSPASPVEWVAVTNSLPLVTIGQAPRFVSDQDALRLVGSSEFWPSETVLLPEAARTAVRATRVADAKARLTRLEHSRLEIVTESPAATLLVVAQSYYHRWQALVDGQPAPLLRANHAFQAVEVPAGLHKVEFVYRDPLFRLGVIVSVITTAGLLIGFWLAARRPPSAS